MTAEEERRVVEAAAERIRSYDACETHVFEGESADDVLTDALGPDADLWRWARLARRAFQRAHGRSPDPPTTPVKLRSESSIPVYAARAGGPFFPGG